jgi:broad specificity phosphatase PhoE
MMSNMGWPDRLWIVRHGESAGNVARDEAHSAGAERVILSGRDVDVPLSNRGEEQAKALGDYFADARRDRPDVLLASPYRRAMQTAEIFRQAGGSHGSPAIRVDERLREKEFGILDGLTTSGVSTLEPDQAQFRALLGKFYHRPPGGESWCDVIFRLRSVLNTIALHHGGQRVMIIAHQVVVLCFRYIIEEMTEDRILAIDREGDVANCSITEYRLNPRKGLNSMELVRYNDIEHLVRAPRTQVTVESDRPEGVARG